MSSPPEAWRQLVADSDQLRVLGSGHSFNRSADTTGALVSLDRLPDLFEIAEDRRSVRVGAATRLGELAARLQRAGLALHTLPSLPHISVAGAVVTATHGSGIRSGTLASAVRAVELVTADGTPRTIRSESADFPGAVVSVGALGVVTGFELAVHPTFDVEQTVHEGLTWPALFADLDAILGSGYSVSVFTDWRGPSSVWVKRRVDEPAVDLSWTGARPADGPRHPVPGMPTRNATPQQGAAGPWSERLPHFRAEFTPSVGAELQSEYFVAREHAVPALQAVKDLAAQLAPVLLVTEIRTVAADEFWLSPAYQRPSVAMHFTWTPDTAAVVAVIRQLERALAPWDARPHWGKLFELTPDQLAASYPRWSDFRRLRAEYDPAGKFGNAMLDRFFPRP